MDTFDEVRQAIADEFYEDGPHQREILTAEFWRGDQMLEMDRTIMSYGLCNNDEVRIVITQNPPWIPHPDVVETN